MKYIVILVPEGENNLASIVGSYQMLSRANAIWKGKNGRTSFKIILAGTSKDVGFYNEVFSTRPHVHISTVKKAALVIIPSLDHNYQRAVKENKETIQWLKEQYEGGAEVASICTGAYLLAATGLLDGKSCSTHWIVANSFREMFPKVKLQTDQTITHENGIYTNGGAYSFLNLIIYLVEKYYNKETAIYCAKVFQVEPDRESQSGFAIFEGQKAHNDDIVKKAQCYIESNIDERISVENLSERFAISRRNFDRRFIKATGNTPLEYSQRVKIESAKRTLETSQKTVNEVMYDVGYSDIKAFREVFRKITGMSPLEYKNRYSRESVYSRN